MKICLCSIPVEGVGERLLRGRNESSVGIAPKVAIVSLINWMKKHGYTEEEYDFYDIDMLYPADREIESYFKTLNPTGDGPTVVGLSAVVSTSYQQVKRVARIVRDIYPDAWIIQGGVLSAVAETVIHKTEIDVCVVGDGEIALVSFLNYVKEYSTNKDWDYERLKKIQGLCFINDKNELVFNGYGPRIPSEDIAYPDYDLLRKGLKNHPEMIQNYFSPASKAGLFNFDSRSYEPGRAPMIAGIFVTKGCVARCSFCQRSTKGYRTMSLIGLEKHLMHLKQEFNVGFIQILDENFGSNKAHGYAVARLMKKLDLLWLAVGVRCKSVKWEDAKFYKEHNCTSLKIGFESGSQKILDIMEKKFLVEDVFNAVKNCIDNGLFSPLAVMLGMPGETVQTAQETGAFLGKLHSILGVHPTYMDYNIYYALPLPGTALYEYGIQSGFIDGSINGVEEYLESVTNAAAYKRYFMNLTGAPHGEVLSWDWILKLEASWVFRQNQKKQTNSFVANKMKEVYEENQRINAKTNPHVKMQYTSMKFTVITRFLDRIVSGNFYFIDRIPRIILYPLVRYVVSFEFMIQAIFKKNREHYIFKGKARSENIQMIDVGIFNESTRSIGKSLRKVVKRNDNEELMTVTEKSRKLLMRGL
jgi:radical SAM superfamily enzyme YgiQ (UPF0313 family)